jgi:hypothetical protein
LICRIERLRTCARDGGGSTSPGENHAACGEAPAREKFPYGWFGELTFQQPVENSGSIREQSPRIVSMRAQKIKFGPFADSPIPATVKTWYGSSPDSSALIRRMRGSGISMAHIGGLK